MRSTACGEIPSDSILIRGLVPAMDYKHSFTVGGWVSCLATLIKNASSFDVRLKMVTLKNECFRKFHKILSNFRARRSHWENLHPTSGRPYSGALRELTSQWGNLTVSDKTMRQEKTLTTDQEVQELAKRSEAK